MDPNVRDRFEAAWIEQDPAKACYAVQLLRALAGERTSFDPTQAAESLSAEELADVREQVERMTRAAAARIRRGEEHELPR